MGSCMAHLNCIPLRAAAVNFWFFIAVPFGGGCWHKAKCEMLLHKIDSEKNVQNCGFSVKLRNEDGGNMLHDQRQRQLSRTPTVIFRRYDKSSMSKSCRRWPGNPYGRLKVHNLCLFTLARSQLTLRQRLTVAALWLTTASGDCSTTHCQCQTHRRRWPSNPNGRLKFRNFFVYVSKIATNVSAAADGDRSNSTLPTSKTSRWRPSDYQDRSKFRNYENLCLRDQAQPLEKHLFAVRSPLLRWRCALFFSYYHSQRLSFSPTKNNFSMTLTPHRKTEIYILKFFVYSIYSKTIDIIIQKCWFSIFNPLTAK